MSLLDRAGRAAANFNLALACGVALGYVPMGDVLHVWLHLMMWPAMFFAAVFTVGAAIKVTE